MITASEIGGSGLQSLVGHNRCRVRLLGEAGEAHRDAFARMMPQAADQISAVTVDPPSVTFEERMALHLGNVSLELQYFGRAHTDNDITITVVDTGHCFAGDLIEESGPPVALESFPRDWGASIRALVGSGATSYIPGHGRAVPGDHALRLPNELTAERGRAAPLRRSHGVRRLEEREPSSRPTVGGSRNRRIGTPGNSYSAGDGCKRCGRHHKR